MSMCVVYVCSGKHYGCIVRKKVMLLEELKRDTPEFGGFGRAVTSAVCVFVFALLFSLCWLVWDCFSRALTSMFLPY